MRRFKDLAMGRKLQWLSTATAALALSVFALSGALLERSTGRDALLDKTEALGDVVAANTAAALVFDDPEAALQVLRSLNEDASIIEAALLDAGGTLLAEWSRSGAASEPHRITLGTSGHRFDGLSLVTWRPVLLEDRVIGTLSVKADTSGLRDRVRRQAGFAVLAILGALVVVFSSTRWLQSFVSAPIVSLAETARRVTQGGDYTLRVTGGGRDEVGRLIEAFNEMLAQVEARDMALHRHRQALEDEVAQRTTDLRAMNRDLRRERDRAAAASMAKSEFLANMSHEIRTPMNGVIGMVELVLETELEPRQREHLELLRSSAESLLRIINDILDVSKIEAGRFELERVPFDLRELLSEPLRLLAVAAHRKGLELVLDVDEQVPARLVGDPLRIRQVVTNLVGNAVKFTEAGEVVVLVSADVITGDAISLHLRVRDTGPGVPEDMQQAIFEAFAQGEQGTTKRHGGTGLGLTICGRLARLMGGRTWVESVPGHGSTFHFTAGLGVESAVGEALPSPPELVGVRTLVVDDNATNRTLVGAILSRAGLEVEVVGTARQGLETLIDAKRRGEPVRLVVLDSRMPDEDGFWLAERIAARSDLAEASIMMLTSAMGPEVRRRCRELGIGACVTKPIRRSELILAASVALGLVPASESELGVEAEDAAETPTATQATGRLAGTRILVAEDNAVNRLLARTLLERAGCSVLVAEDGHQAVAVYEATPDIDLVLMDVQMPELDGMAATRRIRELERGTGRHVPIIAATAYAMAEDAERCLEAGMDAHVPKPLDRKRLFGLIEELLSRQTVGSHQAVGERIPEPGAGSPPAAELEARGKPVDLDLEGMLARAGGDRALADELLGLVAEELRGALESWDSTLASGEPERISRSAHALAGLIAHVDPAGEARRLAGEIERSTREGLLPEERVCRQLDEALGDLSEALATALPGASR